jgi:hypothetical protein
MTRTLRSSALVVASPWVGVGFCLGFVVAPYLFALAARQNPAVPNSGVAAELIGLLLYGSDVMGLVVGAALLLTLVILRGRGELPMGGRFYFSEIGVGLAFLCAAANYWVLAPRIREVQGSLATKYGAFHQADRDDPLFGLFRSLHQTSTMLFLLGFAAALVCLICMTQFQSRRAPVAGPA